MSEERRALASQHALCAAGVGCLAALVLPLTFIQLNDWVKVLRAFPGPIAFAFVLVLLFSWVAGPVLLSRGPKWWAFIARGMGIAWAALAFGAFCGGFAVGIKAVPVTLGWVLLFGSLPACIIGACTGLLLRRSVLANHLTGASSGRRCAPTAEPQIR